MTEPASVPTPSTAAAVPSDTDAALLSLYRRGKDDAATELYLRYAERLRSMTAAKTSAALQQRLDPEDIVQSVFRTFFRRAAAGEYRIPEGEELWKLFLVIGLNKIRAAGIHHGAAKRDLKRTVSTAETDATGDDDASLMVLKLTIDELLAPLPESYRQTVTLRIAGHDLDAIAQATGRSKRSVERILQEFRVALQGQIHDDA